MQNNFKVVDFKYDAGRSGGAAGTELVENGAVVRKLGVPRWGLLEADFDLAQKCMEARYGSTL